MSSFTSLTLSSTLNLSVGAVGFDIDVERDHQTAFQVHLVDHASDLFEYPLVRHHLVRHHHFRDGRRREEQNWIGRELFRPGYAKPPHLSRCVEALHRVSAMGLKQASSEI
ncbi:MAG: hypothetical protein GX147_03865 [Deltaproteobacteria bacterium]|nr:hypothetical protein [Deltaproteobacteria bacterium]